MRILRFLAAIVLVVPSLLFAQSTTPEARAIRAVLDKQVADWNRGDMEAFAAGYKNSPDILFIGSKISRGYAQMLDTYRKNYSTKEKMGTLIFSDLDTRMLCATNAVTTGRYKLTFADGKPARDGIFSLVWNKTPQGWKIVLDHTS